MDNNILLLINKYKILQYLIVYALLNVVKNGNYYESYLHPILIFSFLEYSSSSDNYLIDILIILLLIQV